MGSKPLEDQVSRWDILKSEEFEAELSRVNNELEKKCTFEEVNIELRKKLCQLLDARFQETQNICKEVLRFIRIIARDERNLDSLLTSILVNKILTAASLTESQFEYNWEVLTQAEMCLINVFFNSMLARNTVDDYFLTSLLCRIDLIATALDGSLQSGFDVGVTDIDKKQIPQEFEKAYEATKTILNHSLGKEQLDLLAFYDLRIAFVLSAKIEALQKRWLKDGCQVFIKVLRYCLEHPENLRISTSCDTITGSSSSCQRPHVERANWAAKILFNLYYRSIEEQSEKDNATNCMLLCVRIITMENVNKDIEQSAMDLLAVLPVNFEVVVPKVLPDSVDKVQLTFGGRDMTLVDACLCAFERRLIDEDSEDNELLGTYLTVLIKLCIQICEARRYLRLKVIPPLRASDVERPPEQGAELRNRLVRMMMSMSANRELAAEFIFILCKKNVSRIIKYCGFGHAAGLLANQGLFGRLALPKNASDSEDSETEDYKAVESMVNPVTGYMEAPRSNPLEGMSDERKEYEVDRLMNDISKLMNQGVIKPGIVDETGHLRPAKHVLELVKNDEKNKDAVPEDDDKSDVD